MTELTMTKKLTTSQRIKQDKPIEIWQAGNWTWKVWKKNHEKTEATNPYASWFCSVSSPMTYGGWDMGDTYVADVKSVARMTYKEGA